MRPKIGMVCIGPIGQALIKAIDDMNLDADFILSDSIAKDETQLPPELSKADVLLSSGYLTKVLYKLTDKPIIKIEPSLFDILLAYDQAISLHTVPVIILPAETRTPQITQIQNIMSVEVVSEYYETLDSIDAIILKYKKSGYSCVIGSGLVCDRASHMGMTSIFVYPQESLQSFIHLAYDTALSICQKTEINQQLTSVFQYSKQGILFTDENGRISIFNNLAEKILQADKDQLSRRTITEFFPRNQLNPVFHHKESIKYLMCSFGNEHFMASAIPILSKGELSNVMVTISSIDAIQKQEQHIRSSLALKGFVAKHHFEDIISISPRFQTLLRAARRFAKSDDCIIILGETGTGKEVLAQSIHNHSKRCKNPFVAVNCSAISENLLESELFGYDEGAFTGAKKGGKQGYFEIAHKGTIFLDEIGELSLPLQSKLLRVIQEQQLVHVGGSKVINFDVRIIAATNRNLWELVQQKQFREDLYYRLAVLELEIPPLRQRKEDILPLFLGFIAKQDSILAVELEQNHPSLGETLCSHTWPGNVREMENFVKTIIATRAPSEPTDITWELLKQEIYYRKKRCEAAATFISDSSARRFSPDEEMERIQAALNETSGNYTKAAALLGISRVTLWRKLKAFKNPNL
ncbi:MAG: sigma 54-interacting transcriptional regulator [Lachnoclostridium edouardi]|uniref:sigma 54-interacting transcriptional regulator n=1 Tax=Lachnoclostridium edouardi TaxID=1926283 RepID=UPI0026DC1D83|nr:sigma 54-interacting transcriptional regulator [Lachnoclostridium edouardi]MDO4277426.1 sigma 54-interacting transcriptional regulator [Lachnoclostridium edouardi]